MIYINKTKTPPKCLDIQKQKKDGDYNKPEVKELLYKDFFHKCYICEIKPLQDGGIIEHLISHKKNVELKFNWSNLFLSCGHCNSVKNCGKYEKDILDCTKLDPSQHIKHTLNGDLVKILVLNDTNSSQSTASLIEECFNGNSTVTRKEASKIRVDELKLEMTKFISLLNSYVEKPIPYNKNKIIAMLQSNTSYTAFKRDYIRNNTLFDCFLENL